MKLAKLSMGKGLLEELYWKQGLSLKEIGQRLGKAPSTIFKWMHRYGISCRPPGRVKKFQASKQQLEELYLTEGLSTQQIAHLEKFQVSPSTVLRRMRELGIPIKRQGAELKYPKISFNRKNTERDYLIGLRIGDLNVRRHRHQIRIALSSAHPGMIEIFRGILQKYTHINQCPRFNRIFPTYDWWVYGYFDNSFKFLLLKPQTIPTEILKNDRRFFAFLAGYTDAEGSLVIYPNRNYIGFIYSLGSEDFGVLSGICGKLAKMGYYPLLRLKNKKGTKISNPYLGSYRLTKDLWSLELRRKEEVLRLIQRLPLRYSENLGKRELMLEIKNFKLWRQVESKILALQMEIEREVKQSIVEAFQEHQRKHPNENLPRPSFTHNSPKMRGKCYWVMG